MNLPLQFQSDSISSDQDEVTKTIAAIRALGPEVEKAAAIDLAEMRAEKLVSELRFLRFGHGATRAAAALARLEDPKTQTILAALGADAHDLAVGVRAELRRIGTTREKSHFSHPGKRKFSPRPSRTKLRGAP
jgi:hypothetical protein